MTMKKLPNISFIISIILAVFFITAKAADKQESSKDLYKDIEDKRKKSNKSLDSSLWFNNKKILEHSNLSRNEITILRELVMRRELIDKKEQELNNRELMLESFEKSISGKISHLKSIKKDIEQLLKKYDTINDERNQQFVRIYSAMKPRNAARVFDSLDVGILKNIVLYMKDATFASIASYMDAEKVKELMAELAIVDKNLSVNELE